MLDGELTVRHPVHGEELQVKLTDGRLVLAGEVPNKHDRDQLVTEARARIGRGFHELDASQLKVKPKAEKSGLLAQTLVAAFAHRDSADFALKYVLEHSHSKPLRAQVVDQHSNLADVLPDELVDDAKRQLERGQTLVVVDTDETEAFRVRSLMDEDTHSTWTAAAPPRLIKAGRN